MVVVVVFRRFGGFGLLLRLLRDVAWIAAGSRPIATSSVRHFMYVPGTVSAEREGTKRHAHAFLERMNSEDSTRGMYMHEAKAPE